MGKLKQSVFRPCLCAAQVRLFGHIQLKRQRATRFSLAATLAQCRQQLHEIALGPIGLADGLQFIGELRMLLQFCSQFFDSPHNAERLFITGVTRSTFGGDGHQAVIQRKRVCYSCAPDTARMKTKAAKTTLGD